MSRLLLLRELLQERANGVGVEPLRRFFRLGNLFSGLLRFGRRGGIRRRHGCNLLVRPGGMIWVHSSAPAKYYTPTNRECNVQSGQKYDRAESRFRNTCTISAERLHFRRPDSRKRARIAFFSPCARRKNGFAGKPKGIVFVMFFRGRLAAIETVIAVCCPSEVHFLIIHANERLNFADFAISQDASVLHNGITVAFDKELAEPLSVKCRSLAWTCMASMVQCEVK